MLTQTISRRWRTLLGIALVAAIVDVAFVTLLPETFRANEASDYFSFYRPLAQNIAAGNGLVMNGRLPSRYPPGFPVYLAFHFLVAKLLGLSAEWLITAGNVVLSTLSCFLIYWIARLAFTERIACFAALLWATYPFNLWLLKQPNSEVPFIFVLFLSVWLFLRSAFTGYIPLLLVGVLTGVAALIRPIALLVALLLSLSLLFRYAMPLLRRLIGAAMILACFLVAILPWEVALHRYSGHWVLLSTGGPPSMVNGLDYPLKYNGRSREWIPPAASQLIDRVKQHEASLATTSDIAKWLFQQFKADPVALTQLMLLKLWRSWFATESMLHERAIGMVQSAYGLLAIAGVWLAWRRFAEARWLIALLVVLVLYFWAMTTLVLSIVRYMVPAMGFLMIFGAIAIDSALQAWTPFAQQNRR